MSIGGAGQAIATVPFPKMGQGPQTLEYTAGLRGGPPESASLGPRLRKIGLALWVGGRDLMWFEGNLLLK